MKRIGGVNEGVFGGGRWGVYVDLGRSGEDERIIGMKNVFGQGGNIGYSHVN